MGYRLINTDCRTKSKKAVTSEMKSENRRFLSFIR